MLQGVATHSSFRKWQLDILINGDEEHTSFIAVGDEPVPHVADLTLLDTTRYPDGNHILRLRVVHTNLNYDEYAAPVTFANHASADPAPPVASISPVTADKSIAPAKPTVPPAPVHPSGDTATAPVVYLTFDDGPHPVYTRQIANLLSQYDARATFFMVGEVAQAHPELIRTLYEAGHGIANHSWNHTNLAALNEAQFRWQIQRAEQVLDPYTAPCLRPPYGITSASLQKQAAKLGYKLVMWHIDPIDWKNPGPDVIANRVVGRIFPGAIVLLHDGSGNRSQTVSALGRILSELHNRGYRFEPYCR